MRTIFFICSFITVISLAAYAHPITCDDVANTCTYRITVTEPTLLHGGGILTSLQQVNIKTSLNGGTFTTITKIATVPTGGGTVLQDVTFATKPCSVTKLSVKVSATNLSNHEGAESVIKEVSHDRSTDPTCAPAVPNFSIN